MTKCVTLNNSYQEATFDNAAVDAFAHQMKCRLYQARTEKGRYGWSNMSVDELQAGLAKAVMNGDAVDIANYSMFLWWALQTDA